MQFFMKCQSSYNQIFNNLTTKSSMFAVENKPTQESNYNLKCISVCRLEFYILNFSSPFSSKIVCPKKSMSTFFWVEYKNIGRIFLVKKDF